MEGLEDGSTRGSVGKAGKDMKRKQTNCYIQWNLL